MKYLKKFEMSLPRIRKKLPEYSGLVYIHLPSETFFKSSIRFTLVFVDDVIEEVYDRVEYKSYNNYNEYIYKSYNNYNITANISFQISEFSSGDLYSIQRWYQDYTEKDFKMINFMTIQEFYNKYTEEFIKILNIILDKINNQNLRVEYKRNFEELLNKLTIPEVEYIINSRKYNL